METVFEEIIFNPDLSVAGLQIIWWGHFSPMVRSKIEQLQSLRRCNFDVGLVLNSCHSSEDFVQDSDEEEDDPEEQQVQKAAEEIQSVAKSTCEKLGYQFKIEEEGRWTKREMYDWDLKIHL